MARSENELRTMFEEDPTSMEAFSALRRMYQNNENWEHLAWLYNLRGDALDANNRKADMYFKAADLYFSKLNDEEKGVESLYLGVLMDPRHRRNSKKLKEYLLNANDTERYLVVLEKEIDLLTEQGTDKRGLSMLHMEAGDLFAKTDDKKADALRHYKSAFKLDNRHTDALNKAAEILLELKAYEEALPLLSAQLNSVRDPSERAKKLQLIANIKVEHVRDVMSAEKDLREAIKLLPEDSSLLYSLTEVYTDRRYPKEEGEPRAARVFLRLARIHHKDGDLAKAITSLNRSLSLDSQLEESFSLLASILEEQGEWEALSDILKRGIDQTEGQTKYRRIIKRCEILEQRLNRVDDAIKVYEDLVEEAPDVAIPKLASILETNKDYDALAKLREKQLRLNTDPIQVVSIRLSLVYVYKDLLGRNDKAASHLHEILSLEPENLDALMMYVDHFRQKADYRSQADTMELALEVAKKKRASRETIIQLAKEMADLYHRHLGDLEKTESALRLLVRADPQNERYKGALNKVMRKREMWEGYKADLLSDIENAASFDDKLYALRNLARELLERKLDVSLNIKLFQQILKMVPTDEDAFEGLETLLVREGDMESLYRLFDKKQSSSTPEQKEEILYRMFDIAKNKLADPNKIGRTAAKILELIPGDEEAMLALVEALEALENWPKLAVVLEKYANGLYDPEEKSKFLIKAAHVYEKHLNRLDDAVRILNAVIYEHINLNETVPHLIGLYEELNDYSALASLLSSQLFEGEWPETEEGIIKSWKKLGALQEKRLSEPEKALESWMKVLDYDAENIETLAVVARLSYQLERWDILAMVMRQQVENQETDEQKLNLTLKLADIYDNKLGQPDEALALLEELDGESMEVQTRLANLYTKMGDPERAVAIYEKWLKIVEEDEEKVSLCLKIAGIYNNDIGDGERASAFVDVALALEPENIDALSLQVELCKSEGLWERLIEVSEKLLSLSSDPAIEFGLTHEIAKIYEEKLEDFEHAILWYHKGLEISHEDDELISAVERVAKQGELWSELLAVYDFLLKHVSDAYLERDYFSRAAQILEENLKESEKALDYINRFLFKYPLDEDMLSEAERLAATFPTGFENLISIFEHLINNSSNRLRQSELLIRAAVIMEEEINDKIGALTRYERAFRANPFEPATIIELERLSRETEKWDIYYAVQGVKLASIEDPLEKVDYIVKSAEIIESEAKDDVRAFRAYLHGFILEPVNNDIIENLWRLAKKIGVYTEKQRVFHPLDLSSWFIKGMSEYFKGREAFEKKLESPGTKRPEVTHELDFDEIEFVEEDDNDDNIRKEDLFKPELTSPTNSLTMQDLIESRRNETGNYQEISISQVMEEYEGDVHDGETSIFSPIGNENQEYKELAPPSSPWEEMVRAYAMLPHTDSVTRVSHLKEMARIWNEGADKKNLSMQVLGRAMTIIPEDTEIHDLLKVIAKDLNKMDLYAILMEKVASNVSIKETACRLYERASVIYREMELVEKEESALRAILSIFPNNDEAYNYLTTLLEKSEAWMDLIAIKEWKFELELENLDDETKMEFQKSIAILYEEKVEDNEVSLSWWMEFQKLEPDDSDCLAAILRLSKKVNAWSKAAETLRHLSDLSDSDTEILGYLHELGSITENELDLPDQAITIYKEIRSINSKDIDALKVLDRLYTTHELWDDLEDILHDLIDFTEDKNESYALMDRYGKILGKLKRFSEAASVYNDLWDETGDTKYAIKSSQMYMDIGEPSQGVEILHGLLNSESGNYSNNERASMWTQLANIQKNSLQDLDGCRKSLNSALDLDENHSGAIALLSEIARENNRWERFAELQVRLGKSLTDPVERETAWYIAGNAYRDNLKDLENAKSVFKMIVNENSENYDALTALNQIAETQEDWNLAFNMLGKREALVSDNIEKAKMLTRQAEISLHHFDDNDKAYELLSAALEYDANFVGAILALADLAEKREEWSYASDLLENALKKLKDDSFKVAQLGRKYAQMMQKQGKGENAVTLLTELDRKHPDELLIKLTLGEIRYHSGRWRETTKLLNSIAKHPQAEQFPNEVATALCFAAEAEKKQRKGANPKELWEAAVRIKPDHLPAIEALIEYHLERGHQNEAAGYLRAQAEAATNAETRMSLYQSLGDLYRDKLKNDAKAFDCYISCYHEIDLATSDELELLQNICDLSEKLGRDSEAFSPMIQLIDLLDEKERLVYYIRAGEVALNDGDIDTAREYYEIAQKRAPANEKVLRGLSLLYEQDERFEEAAKLLENLLDRQAIKSLEKSEQAGMYERLGNIYLKLEGKERDAEYALEKALKLDDNLDRVRLNLINLYNRVNGKHALAVKHQQIIASKNPLNLEVIKGLVTEFEKTEKNEEKFLYYQILKLLGELGEEQNAWLDSKLIPIDQESISYSGQLTPEDLDNIDNIVDIGPMAEVFEALWEAAPSLFGSDLSSLGLSSSNKVSPVDKGSLALIYSQTAKVVGARNTGLYIGPDDIYQGVTVACHAPPIVIVGESTVNELAGTLRFLLGRSFELARPKFILAAGYFPEEFSKFFSGLIRAFHPRYKRREFKTLDPIDSKATELKKVLPYRVNKNLVEIFNRNSDYEFNSGEWRRNVWMAGNRAGLLVTGDLFEALRLVVWEEAQEILEMPIELSKLRDYCNNYPAVFDLLKFHISSMHIGLREKIGMNIT